MLEKVKEGIGKKIGSGALSGKVLLLGIVENNKIDAYFRAGYVK